VAQATAPWLALIAADLPFLFSEQLTDLPGRALESGRVGAVLADAEGRPHWLADAEGRPHWLAGAEGRPHWLADAEGRLQWLAGGWHADVLRTALGGYHGNSLQRLLAPLAPLKPVAVQSAGRDGGFAPWRDCDTVGRPDGGTPVVASPRHRSDRRGMTTLDNWTAAACEKLGIEVALVDIRQILGLARVAAHQVDRPAAPLSAYLLGLAVGTGQSADQAAAQLEELAKGWPQA
jgi:hypothetical protein